MKNLTSWLLGGALAASLTWNLRPASEREPACTKGGCAAVDPVALGLDATQRAALGSLCGRSCGESERLERDADAKQRELLARLAEPELDTAALPALVNEVADLRRRALQACVDGVVSVRQVLSAQQLRSLLAQCDEKSCARTE